MAAKIVMANPMIVAGSPKILSTMHYLLVAVPYFDSTGSTNVFLNNLKPLNTWQVKKLSLMLSRAMAFIVQLFPTLIKSDPNQTSIIRDNIIKLYGETLAKFHPWIVRKAVHLALWAACPSREKLLSLVHYDEPSDDLKKKCEHLSSSSEKVMDKVQKIYEAYGILDLP